MKIVTASAMSEIESIAYQNGYVEKDFMENAGKGIAIKTDEFLISNNLSGPILILAGKGNNGGDGFTAGYHLLKQGYSVSAVLLDDPENCSILCKQNYNRFKEQGGLVIRSVPSDFSDYHVILDGIFGTGFKGEVKDPYASLIKEANASKVPILAIDIPSGLNGNTGDCGENVIQARTTLFLGLPKIGFFLKNGWNHVGLLEYVDFGLPQQYIHPFKSGFEWITHDTAAALLPPIKRNRHKYQSGQVIGLAGSPSMPGAALLSSLAALRGGCGMIRLLFPHGMEAMLSGSFYELIKESYEYEKTQDTLATMQKARSIFVGPGLGCSEKVGVFLQQILPHLIPPCVIDADALTLFAKGAYEKPKHAIFTPHMGEMQRLLNISTIPILDTETLRLCQEYAIKHEITLVLKGAPTWIFHPEHPIYINSTGTPGMATAGSGDVLTGLLASLLAQGLCCHNAAILGVYLHGLSGEYAAEIHTDRSMIASDIIDSFKYSYSILDSTN